MIYALATLATLAMLYLFSKWMAATPEPHAPRTTVDAFYSHGRIGSTDWDSIPENAQL